MVKYTTGPLTEETIVEAYDLMLKNYGEPEVEYHHPLCPKILSGGMKACRCGANILEAILEDALGEELGRSRPRLVKE